MPQHDMILDNNPGVTFRADINAALAALVSVSSGSTEPAKMYAGMMWLDTSVTPDGLLRQRNQSNTAWVAPVGTIGTNIRRTVLTTSQTWTKPPGLRYLDVICVGGGGGTGAAPATAAAQGSACSGGGGGGVAIKFYKASDLNPTVSVTIGAGGATTPGAGGATIFAGLNGAGGSAGTVLVAGTQAAANGGMSGAGTGGDVNIQGEAGGTAWRLLTAAYSQAGAGGSNGLCCRLAEMLTATTMPGSAGNFPGGGARGSAQGVSQASAAAGAAGGTGVVIMMEYY